MLLDPLLGLRERLPTEAIELGSPFAARPFLNLVEPINRQVQLVAAAVLDHQEVDGEPPDVLVHQAVVLADAVLDVDDVIAHRERAQIFEKGLGPLLGAALFGPVHASSEDFLFGDQDQRFGRRDHPSREGPYDHGDLGAMAASFERPRVEATRS